MQGSSHCCEVADLSFEIHQLYVPPREALLLVIMLIIVYLGETLKN